MEWIVVAIVVTVTIWQWYGQYKFIKKSNQRIELHRKILSNEMEMCRLRDSLVLSIDQNDWIGFKYTNDLLKDKIQESQELLDKIKTI